MITSRWSAFLVELPDTGGSALRRARTCPGRDGWPSFFRERIIETCERGHDHVDQTGVA